MKRLIPVLLCLMLLGCSTQEQPPETAAPETIPTAPTVPAGTYDAGSSLEQETYGAIRVYPLGMENVQALYPMGERVVILSGTDTDSDITCLSGDTLYPESTYSLGFPLDARDLTVHSGSFSYYHPEENALILVSVPQLEERRLAVPQDLVGRPVLSSDYSTMYYCTADSVRALDTESGISRLLKEISCCSMDIARLSMADRILQVTLEENSGDWLFLYLSTQDGRILWEDSGELSLCCSDSHYFASRTIGCYTTHLFGTPQQAAMELLPREPDAYCAYLPQRHGVITVSSYGDSQVLDCYDLNTGLRTGTLTLPFSHYIHSFSEARDGRIWFLCYSADYDCDVLYSWDPVMTLTGDDRVYTARYHTAQDPDYQGLDDTALYANTLGEKYGIEILIYKDAAASQPPDYALLPEHRVPVLRRELELLDQYLGNYPQGFLKTLAEHFNGIRLCIVNNVEGYTDTGSLTQVDGLQFRDGQTACIALAAGRNTEYSLYHELCHLIDSVVLTRSNAYDQWDSLNPKDFKYDYDYLINSHRDGSAYLQEDSRSFIDTYAMSFPKEDRARIMEYAMTQGNEHYFASPAMQNKLLTVCQGIRDAFGLKKSPDTFLWEQYLKESLAWIQ